MRSALSEWYGHNDKTVADIVKTGTIALDTNALLDLYRVSRDERDDILDALSQVKDRLFLPYQVALEFQRNRLNVVQATSAIYNKFLGKLSAPEEHLNSIRDKKVRTEIKAVFDDAATQLKKAIEEIRDRHALSLDEAQRQDPVLKALDELFEDDAIGTPPTDEELQKHRNEANRRIKERIPPGYADAKNKEDPTGDYLIWRELLDYSAKSDRALLFVTNDENKGDWYREKVAGRSVGVRPELLIEMRRASPNHAYHQVPLGTFLWLTKKHLGAHIEDETIKSVERIKPSSRYEDLGKKLGEQFKDIDPDLLALSTHKFLTRDMRDQHQQLWKNFVAAQMDPVFKNIDLSKHQAWIADESRAVLHDEALRRIFDKLAAIDDDDDSTETSSEDEPDNSTDDESEDNE
ncbi:PIN domain-containing protein [Mycolicibacterium smegmatis]|nr:PIN domain-containing protein [Mycolicibacterium smegmatis]AFP39222.1 hypothetical protein MSMEI_2754 [Mycolicibacterium smegmatis MC2 155]MBE9622349.1 DUF4935 domain-containing protein [Mycolicibacterium smegmatis]MBE9628759.1 DUF4935 domain-containing protein [Mycolicibacterium smegmatis]MBE9635178.1 DUF4935 domain-containing protein [Mycolicibacterium smegmatis]MBE9647390.1 DUF4935 domain-containing protein [Mycolicibacterium smegmatis]